ncbi:MAG TPA: family 20 glycosylhydrolase [Planctomycetota bacterium]|jgi:hexosaminidase
MERAFCSAILFSLAMLRAPVFAGELELPLVPWPQTIKAGDGALGLQSESRIVAADPKLEPLAKVLAEEIQKLTGLSLAVGAGKAGTGEIGLALDAGLKGEAYRLTVDDKVLIEGGNYGSAAWGTVTLLQALNVKDKAVSVPRVTINDEPKTPFRGLLVDVARRFHSIDNLKQMVQLCRFYKIRYLQLHLTDDPAFTFPSKAYPQLTTKNHHGGPSYTLEQLYDLVAYADARNVTIIPEYECPGHSGAANRAMHDLFVIKDTKPYEHHASINFAREDVMQAVATIVGEMCEVFKSSPYFHIGGDEADLALAGQNVDFKAAFEKYKLPNQHQLYRKFVCDMNEIVKKNGKQTIVWEGFGREPKSPVQIPKDIIVMEYEIRFYMPDALIRDGYKVINASWTPLYVVNSGHSPDEIYEWQLNQFKPYGAKRGDKGVVVAPEAEVFGAQMCAWEQPEHFEIPYERLRLPPMSERIWNPGAGKSYEDFEKRLLECDRRLGLLVHRFGVKAEGTRSLVDTQFDKEATLSISGQQGLSFRYTLDGKAPTVTSAAYAEPIKMTTSTELKVQAFDAEGKVAGYPFWTRYAFCPVSGSAPDASPDDRFTAPIKVTLKSTVDGEIRYTLDGKDPAAGSAVYAEPISLEKTTTVKAALFSNGKRSGEVWTRTYTLQKQK